MVMGALLCRSINEIVVHGMSMIVFGGPRWPLPWSVDDLLSLVHGHGRVVVSVDQ